MNEIFYSIQGEGIRAGTPNVFVRFSGCNMKCRKEAGEDSPGGFDCDTEFMSGRNMTAEEIHKEAYFLLNAAGLPMDTGDHGWMILTGGEPGLQVDQALVSHLNEKGFALAIETNGSVDLAPLGPLGWITVSPKVAEHAILQRKANEVKYVRGYGQGIPKTVVEAEHKLISPAFDGMELDPRTLAWCIKLVKENPEWALSVQQHKGFKVR